MKFTLINEINKKKFIYENDDSIVKSIHFDNDNHNFEISNDLFSSTSQFINYINDSDVLNFISNNYVEIVLTNEDVPEMYHIDSKTIYISRNFLMKNSSSNYDNFVDYLVSNVDFETATQVVIAHEMAHSFQHKLYEINNTHILERDDNFNDKFLNSVASLRNYHSTDQQILDYFEKVNPQHQLKEETILNLHKSHDVNYLISQSVEEGFADLYSCLTINNLYGKEKALEVTEKMIEGRKEFSPDYPTYYTLNTFLDDLKNNPSSLDFNNFNELHQYMSKTISNSTDLFLNDILSGQYENTQNTGNQQLYNSKFLGTIHSLADKNFLENPNNLDLNNQKNLLTLINRNTPEIVNFSIKNNPTSNLFFEESKNIYGDFLDGKPQQSFIDNTNKSSTNDYAKSSKFKKHFISDSLKGNKPINIFDDEQTPKEQTPQINKTMNRKKDGLGY